MSFFAACIAILLGVCTAKAAQRQTVVVGADLGTESARVGIFNTRGEQLSTATASYTTTFPKAGWAEQSPDDWWTCLSGACKKALSQLDFDIDIAGLCVDTTCCSVVALDKDFRPLRPCLLWMDSRSFQETDEILKKGQGDEALKINCNGEGPLSAEWMIPKSLWIKKNEPDIWKKAKYVCESQDYMNYRMTGRYCASTCNCGPRWHWNAEKACLHTVANPMPKSTNYISELAAQAPSDSFVAGRPVSLLRKVGMEDILDKWPQECVGMGQVVGKLTPAAAKDLGLPAGIPVAQGGADAYVGIVGLG
jgi:ribulose kinase